MKVDLLLLYIRYCFTDYCIESFESAVPFVDKMQLVAQKYNVDRQNINPRLESVSPRLRYSPDCQSSPRIDNPGNEHKSMKG